MFSKFMKLQQLHNDEQELHCSVADILTKRLSNGIAILMCRCSIECEHHCAPLELARHTLGGMTSC